MSMKHVNEKWKHYISTIYSPYNPCYARHMSTHQNLEQAQKDVLEHLFQHAVFDGFNHRTLERACRDAGHANLADVLFPGGVIEAIILHSTLADATLQDIFTTELLHSKRTHERIAMLIMQRLAAHQHQRIAIRGALAVGMLPQHWSSMQRAVWNTVDTIWYLAGDTSTDYNYYSKRLLLEKAYIATLHYWLRHETGDLAATEAFLMRRLQDTLRVGKAVSSCKKRLGDMVGTLCKRMA